MITTLDQAPRPLPVAVPAQSPASTAWAVPAERSDGWAPYAIGVLLGLLLILALLGWAFALASSGDYSHIIDLGQSLTP